MGLCIRWVSSGVWLPLQSCITSSNQITVITYHFKRQIDKGVFTYSQKYNPAVLKPFTKEERNAKKGKNLPITKPSISCSPLNSGIVGSPNATTDNVAMMSVTVSQKLSLQKQDSRGHSPLNDGQGTSGIPWNLSSQV